MNTLNKNSFLVFLGFKDGFVQPVIAHSDGTFSFTLKSLNVNKNFTFPSNVSPKIIGVRVFNKQLMADNITYQYSLLSVYTNADSFESTIAININALSFVVTSVNI